MFERLNEQCGFESVIPALFMSFPRSLCNSRALYVIPALFMSFPRRRESTFTRRGGSSRLIESADGPPVADYSKLNNYGLVGQAGRRL